jgi:hypothetical protein
MDQPKRKLKINMIDLESAFEHHDPLMETSYFLDLETGEVVMITGEERRLLEEIYEQYGDPETGEVDWPTILPQMEIPDWQKVTLPMADQVEAGYGTRYIAIPQIESYEGYNDMVAFIGTVSNPRLQARLERAISGRGAFRYFKDVLMDYPRERERWFRFQDDRMHQRVIDWLNDENIEPN